MGYLANNEAALIDFGRRYHSGQPVSTSRAEECVDEIANARMAKRRRMRWSPRGAHRVAVVRAAVLDGRLSSRELSTNGGLTAQDFSTPSRGATASPRWAWDRGSRRWPLPTTGSTISIPSWTATGASAA